MSKIKRKSGGFDPPDLEIKSSTTENLKNIKPKILGTRSSVITNLWVGHASENINAYVGAATAGDYGRIKNFKVFEGDEGLKFAGSGKGWTKQQAEISAIGEFFERYASGFINSNIKVASVSAMDGAHFFELNPFFTDDQYQSSNFIFKKLGKDDKISWVKMENAISQKKEWVPAIFCFFPFWGTTSDRHSLPTSTNGIAAHKNNELAKISAIFEIIERDLLTNAWCSGTRFNLSEVPKDRRWDHFFNSFAGEVFCTFPENEFGIPFCILTLKFPPIDGKSLIVSGSACGFSRIEAFSSALLECFQGKKYLELEKGKKFTNKDFLDVQTFTDHCRFYSERNNIFDKIPLYDRRAKNLGFKDILIGESLNESSKLKLLVNIFDKKGLELYFHNLTTIDCSLVGISVWRAYSPNLSSLYGDERFPYHGQPRIWDDGVFLQYLGRNKKGYYNKFPHFMG